MFELVTGVDDEGGGAGAGGELAIVVPPTLLTVTGIRGRGPGSTTLIASPSTPVMAIFRTRAARNWATPATITDRTPVCRAAAATISTRIGAEEIVP